MPIYDTLGEDATFFAFEQAKTAFCTMSFNHLPGILKWRKESKKLQHLQSILILDIDSISLELKESSGLLGIRLFTFSEIKKIGESKECAWACVTHYSIYAFYYTSGSTGAPKGAMNSHQNIVSCLFHTRATLGDVFEDDLYLSYLLVAHVM